jgi:hypothetical protein
MSELRTELSTLLWEKINDPGLRATRIVARDVALNRAVVLLDMAEETNDYSLLRAELQHMTLDCMQAIKNTAEDRPDDASNMRLLDFCRMLLREFLEL